MKKVIGLFFLMQISAFLSSCTNSDDSPLYSEDEILLHNIENATKATLGDSVNIILNFEKAPSRREFLHCTVLELPQTDFDLFIREINEVGSEQDPFPCPKSAKFFELIQKYDLKFHGDGMWTHHAYFSVWKSDVAPVVLFKGRIY